MKLTKTVGTQTGPSIDDAVDQQDAAAFDEMAAELSHAWGVPKPAVRRALLVTWPRLVVRWNRWIDETLVEALGAPDRGSLPPC